MRLASSHEAKVESIAAAFRRRLVDRQSLLPLRPEAGSQLNEVVRIDPLRRLCVVEPGVNFSELVRQTLRLGLLPTVVPEGQETTVAEALEGCAIESMSFRYGGFHDSCTDYEIITSRGRVLRSSRRREPHFFEMFHGASEPLGLLSEVTFQLVPAKPLVQMEYRKFRAYPAFENEMLARCRGGDFDFVDGIIHSKDEFVVCLGKFVDRASEGSGTKYLGTYDYCFRHDSKWILGWKQPPRWFRRLQALFRSTQKPTILGDVLIPARRAAEFHAWYREEFDHFPIWVIPYRIPKPYTSLAPVGVRTMSDKLFLDFAFCGGPRDRQWIEHSQVLEQKSLELNGNNYCPSKRLKYLASG